MNIHIPNCRWRRIHPESEIMNVCLVILGPKKTVIGRPNRWDPQSKQKASNRKCRQKEVREKKYGGNDTQGKGEIFRFRHFLHVFFCYPALHLRNGLQAPFASVTSQPPWITQRVSRIVASKDSINPHP